METITMFVNTQVNFALYTEEFYDVTIWVFASLWDISYSFGQMTDTIQANCLISSLVIVAIFVLFIMNSVPIAFKSQKLNCFFTKHCEEKILC